jgi:uncharacterized protein
MQRRRLLSGSLLLWAGLGSARAATPTSTPTSLRFVAAWADEADRHHLGVLAARGASLEIVTSIELPTRAHGLLLEAGGSVLAAARRPGEWLLRWRPGSGAGSGAAQWLWAEPERRFTGHLLREPQGRWLYSAETDLDSGQGLIAVRDARTLKRHAEWPTHGIDPHQFIVDADGSLLVANGGVPTRPETGRAKVDLDQMDPSFVRLDGRSGAWRGQWRLTDTRLSIRHLARAVNGQVGIALQAEHDDAQAKAAAPVLAVFDGSALRTVDAPRSLAGYGGDIAAGSDGFHVSAPRAGGVAHWDADGRWAGFTPLAEACSLTRVAGEVWAGGRSQVAECGDGPAPHKLSLAALRLDNHWLALPAP